MIITRQLKVPTGTIFVAQGETGAFEFLSIADYGAHVNLNQHKKVENTNVLLPLSKKWVVTVSTQAGCSSNCTFCDVPKVGPGKNLTLDELMGQIHHALDQEGTPQETERLNVHFARMGEPSWNFAVCECAVLLHLQCYFQYNVHPVVSTMMPNKNKRLDEFIRTWMRIKDELYAGNAGLQLSINSTDEEERAKMFSGNALTLDEIGRLMQPFSPVGRKITLNFAVADYKVEPDKLLRWFSPEKYIIKLTPMHKTSTALQNSIATLGDYTAPEPYMELEEKLKQAGYDVLVFIASEDEDLGRITCGNAILSGTLPHKFIDIAQKERTYHEID